MSSITEQIANNTAAIVECGERYKYFRKQLENCTTHGSDYMATHWRKEIRKNNTARKFHEQCIVKLTQQLATV